MKFHRRGPRSRAVELLKAKQTTQVTMTDEASTSVTVPPVRKCDSEVINEIGWTSAPLKAFRNEERRGISLVASKSERHCPVAKNQEVI